MTTATTTATDTRYTLEVELLPTAYADGCVASQVLIYKSITAGVSGPCTDLTLMRAASTDWEAFAEHYGFEIVRLDWVKTNYRGNAIMTYTLALK